MGDLARLTVRSPPDLVLGLPWMPKLGLGYYTFCNSGFELLVVLGGEGWVGVRVKVRSGLLFGSGFSLIAVLTREQ